MHHSLSGTVLVDDNLFLGVFFLCKCFSELWSLQSLQ